MSYVDVWDLVSTIRNLSDKFKSFHLSTCICDAPMWQQPCSFCRYWPDWGADARYGITHDEKRHTCDKERFCKAVNAAGNIMEFYFKSFHDCLDPQHDKLAAAREKAQGISWPKPEEIWDHFTRDDIDYDGSKKKACGNRHCGVSSGIHDGLTFGRGKLDDLGYWSVPCGPCARAWEQHSPDDGACWPFEDKK